MGRAMADLHPDHLAILTLANAALQARDDRTAWSKCVSHAAEIHGVACDAVWEELERQVALQDGRVPVAEHPSVKQKRMIANLRSEIVNVALASIEEAMNDLAKGPMLEEYE